MNLKISNKLFITCSWLIHDQEYSWPFFFTIHSSLVLYLFITFSWLVHYFLMTCTQLSYDFSGIVNGILLYCDLFSTYSWIVHSFFHESSMTCSQFDLELFIICSQLVYKFLMTCTSLHCITWTTSFTLLFFDCHTPLKNEDNHENRDNLKNEDYLKNEGDLKMKTSSKMKMTSEMKTASEKKTITEMKTTSKGKTT